MEQAGKKPGKKPATKKLVVKTGRFDSLVELRTKLRMSALAQAGVSAADAAHRVIPMLSDASRKVRLEAIRQVGERRIKAASDPLLRLIAAPDDLELATAAVAALSRLGGDAVEAAFARVLADTSSPLHRAVLTDLPNPFGITLIEALANLACQRSYPWRERAISALASVHHPRVATAMLTLIDDSDQQVALAAISGLSRYPSPDAQRRAATLLTIGQRAAAPVKIAALELVATHGGSAALSSLSELLFAQPEVAAAYLRAAAKAHARGLEERVLSLVASANTEVALAALDYLKACGSNACAPAVEKALASPNWSIRSKALEVIGALALPNGFDHVIRGLADTNRHVRRAALDSVRSFQDDRAESAIIPLLSDDFHENRALVVRALAMSGSRQVRDRLVDRVRDPHPDVRLAACEALENYDLGGALEKCLRLTADEDPRVREAAGRLLRATGEPGTQVSMGQAYYYLESRDWEKAETVLLTLQATQEPEARVHHELGRLYARTGRTESARGHFERALELKPDHVGSLRALSKLLLKTKDHVAAQRSLTRLLELMPGNVRALKGLGQAHFHLGHFAEAQKFLSEVLESSYDDLESHELLARAYMAQGKHDEARNELAIVQREEPATPRVRALQGELEMAAGAPEAACVHYKVALKGAPGDVALMDALAKAQEAAGNLAEALGMAHELVAKEPAVRTRRLTLARLALVNGDADTALKEAHQLLEADRTDVEALTFKGEAHEARAEYERALDTYFKVHAVDCKTPQLLLKIGRVYQKNGQTEQALRCFREYLQENPKDFETRLVLAKADRESGNHADALRKLAVCLGQRPDDARPYVELARIHAARKDNQRALEQARKALERATDDTQILNMTGKLELEIGDVEQAKNLLERSLALAADQPPVHRLLVSVHAHRGDHARVIFHHHRVGDTPNDPARFAHEVGRAYFGLGHMAKAREWLERGVATDEHHAPLVKALMEVELSARSFERALELGRKLSALAPSDAEARRTVGLILARRGAHLEAEPHLKAVLEVVPEDSEVREALALASFGQGRFQEVVELYPEQLASSGAKPSALLLLASAHFRQGAHAAARAVLERLVDAHPSLVEGHQLLARVLQAMDDLAGAEAALNRALSTDPSNLALYHDRGRVLLRKKEHERARADLLRVHREAPQNAGAVKLLGKLELECGNVHQARAYLDAYGTMESRDGEGQHLRGLVHRKMGQADAALECQENATLLAPELADAYLEAGELALATGDRSRARGHFENYLSRKPHTVSALRGMVEIMQAEGNTPAARFYLEELLKIDSNPRDSYRALLEILFTGGEVQEAWKVVEKIAVQMPDVLAAVGTRFVERNQPALARELLKRAVTHGPTAESYYQLALVNVQLDKPVVAREALRRAIEMDAGHLQAALKLGRLARQAGDLVEAKSALYRVVRLDPDSNEAMAELAALLHREGDHREAARLIERSLAGNKRKPGPETFVLAGEIFESLGDGQRALDCYTSAVGLGGGEGGAAYHRAARLHRSTGNLTAARDLYRGFLMARPGDLPTRVELARVLTAMGQHDGAAREYEVVGANRGFTPEILEPLAAAYIACEKWAEANQINRKLLAAEPTNLSGLVNAGMLASRAKQYAEAFQFFTEATKAHPHSAVPAARAAEALLAQGRHQEALAYGRRACEQEPSKGEFHVILGKVYARLAMPEKAREALERAMALSTKPNAEVAVELARIYKKNRSAKDALDLLEGMRQRGGGTEILLEMARIHFEGKDYTRTLEVLRDMATTSGTRDPQVVEMMGLAFARLGMTQKAGECAAILTSLAYVSQTLVGELARLWMDAGRPAEARTILSEALSRNPNQPQISLELARVHLKLRAFAEAESLLGSLMGSGPHAAEAQTLAGELYEKTRNFERMREVFMRVVHDHPFHAVSHLMLGRACLALGLPMEARNSFKKAVHLDSNLASGHLGLARSLRDCGEASSAVDAYKLALRLEPGNPEVLFELASLFESLDQREMAQFHLRELTRIEPRDSRWAQAARERLERGVGQRLRMA